MSSLDSLREIIVSEDKRDNAALRVKTAKDYQLPYIPFWNDKPCLKHELWKDEFGVVKKGIPKPGCRKCGILPRKHQKVGSMWLYLKHKALLADSTGTGKTVNAALLIALMRMSGETSGKRKIIVVCRAPAIFQWRDELVRAMPDLNVEVASGTKKERMQKYCFGWEVLVIGPQMLLNDKEALENFNLAAVITDDVDTLRNRKNKSAQAIRKLAASSPRTVIMSATPLQKRLPEMYGVLEPIGGIGLFGNEYRFLNRYVNTERVTIPGQRLRPGQKPKTYMKMLGYKNINEFKTLISPLVLRRTPSDIDDVEMPAIVPNDVFLELYKPQRDKYEELREGVLKIVKSEGVQVKHAEALAKLIYGSQICTGLVSIGEEDLPNTAVKLDWIMDKLERGGDFSEEKVVIFANWKNSVRAIQNRLMNAGIGFETIWGENSDKAARKASVDRFWDDPSCQVLLGTSAIEQSLNLQCARHLINVDMIPNPARMTQLAGRISRDGSQHKTVYVHNLLTYDTQEENYLPVLEREQALIDTVWDSTSELFRQLSGLELLQLFSR